MNFTVPLSNPATSFVKSPAVFWAAILTIPVFAIWWWTDYRWRIATGEPPLVPFQIPWLGHGLDFMNNINGFAEWVSTSNQRRSNYPNRRSALYLIFDPKLASQIYRRSQTFIFDPFFLQTSGILGANKKDMKKLTEGAQVVNPIPQTEDTGSRVIHDLHAMTPQYLTGQSLDKLTNMFIDVICADIDKKVPKDKEASYLWETMDICEFVKTTWCHASITALFGANIYKIWPGIENWLWGFDQEFQKLFTQMPRLVMPKPYALLDEGQEMCERWEAEAIAAERDGKIGADPDWDEYWGLRFVRLRNELLRKEGLSTKFRAGNQVVFIWGLNANAIPIAMQAITRAILSPTLLSSLLSEIRSTSPSPGSFNLKAITNLPLFKSVYLESLRWATASPSPRVVRQDTTLGPYHLKKGNMAMVHSRTLQMDEEIWVIPGRPETHPSKFWAERFLEGDDQSEKIRVEENAEAESTYSNDIKSQHPIAKPLKHRATEPASRSKSKEMQARMLALRPFGGGTTLCPGRHFATNEIMGGLAALLLRLEIVVDEEKLKENGEPKPDLRKQGGLFPDRGLVCRVRRRRGV